MSVSVKELNSKRLDRLCDRSQFPLLARIFVMGLVSFEQKEAKALTCIYRDSFTEVLGKLDQHLKRGVFSALATNYDQQGDEELRQNLMRYLEVVTARKCPLEFGMRSD